MTILDRRLHAYREDLADTRLQGRVAAPRFVSPRVRRIASPVVDLLVGPDRASGVNSQLLRGADVDLFDERDGLAWVQAREDGYVGYVDAKVLAEPGPAATHVVVAPRTFVYGKPDMKTPRTAALSMGTRLSVTGEAETRGSRFAITADGEAVFADHLRPVGWGAPDYVAVAEQFEHTPYLWGGTSGFGLDCSGLVQLAMKMAGTLVLRDSDMQEKIGAPLDPGPDFQAVRRGDLVFWKGHVAIVTAPGEVLHANGNTMTVAREPLSAAIARIAPLFGAPTVIRRP
mgnify:CR=1 FL=1